MFFRSQRLAVAQCLYLSGDEKGGCSLTESFTEHRPGKPPKSNEKTGLYAAFTFVSYQPRPRQMHLEVVRNLTLRLDPFPVHASASRYLLQKSLDPVMNLNSAWLPFPSLNPASFLLEAGDWPNINIYSTYACLSCSVKQLGERTVDGCTFKD